jgi:hypothetical protein
MCTNGTFQTVLCFPSLHLVLWISGEGGNFHIFTNTIISVKVAKVLRYVDEIVALDELVAFFCCCIWDNRKKIPWRRLKLCGCTISYEFSISYGIWYFFIHSESHDSLWQNVGFSYQQHITYGCTNYAMHGIPLLSNSSFLKNFWSWWFWHFNSFCRFFGCRFQPESFNF